MLWSPWRRRNLLPVVRGVPAVPGLLRLPGKLDGRAQKRSQAVQVENRIKKLFSSSLTEKSNKLESNSLGKLVNYSIETLIILALGVNLIKLLSSTLTDRLNKLDCLYLAVLS